MSDEIGRLVDQFDLKLSLMEKDLGENFFALRGEIADVSRQLGEIRVQIAHLGPLIEKINKMEEQARKNEIEIISQKEQIRSFEKSQNKIIGTVTFVVVAFAGAIITRIMNLI